MNCTEAKQIPISLYLSSLGIVQYNSTFYKSPFREEKTASFKINGEDNAWYDHGIGKGGTIIDLVMMINNCDVSRALQILRSFQHYTVPVGATVQCPSKKKEQIIIRKITELSNQALIDYVESRKIPIDIAKRYVKEAYYSINEKYYFSLAFENDHEGYELRNKYFKNCLAPKGMTTIDRNFSKVAVFEGFFDFLSYIAFFKALPNRNFVILNSLSFLDGFIRKYFLRDVEIYFDNDDAGREATYKVIEEIKGSRNMAPIIYRTYKDFNDYLMNS